MDFTAERANLKMMAQPTLPVLPTSVTPAEGTAALPRTRIINRPKTVNPFLLTRDEHKALKKKQKEHDKGLRVPRRPQWDETTSKDQLEKNERESFLEWRRGLAE